MDQNPSGPNGKEKIQFSARLINQFPVTEYADRGNLFVFFQRDKCLKYWVLVCPFHIRGVTRNFLCKLHVWKDFGTGKF